MWAEKQGVAPQEVLDAAGLSRQSFDPMARVSRWAYHRIFEAAAQLTGEANFGLQCGVDVDLGNFHVVGYVLSGQKTVSDALHRLSTLHRLLDDANITSVENRGSRVVLAVTEPSLSQARPRHVAEFGAASLVWLVRQHSRGRISPSRVSFAHRRPPGGVAEHMRILGVTPSFGQERIEVEYEDPEAELCGPRHPQGLASHLDVYADFLAANITEESFTRRVERAVFAGMASRHVSIEAVARALGMSGRTLQRRLKQANVTFRIVVDRVRRDAAQHYIKREGLRLPQVAEKVGFSDVSSLRRAMRKWSLPGH